MYNFLFKSNQVPSPSHLHIGVHVGSLLLLRHRFTPCHTLLLTYGRHRVSRSRGNTCGWNGTGGSFQHCINQQDQGNVTWLACWLTGYITVVKLDCTSGTSCFLIWNITAFLPHVVQLNWSDQFDWFDWLTQLIWLAATEHVELDWQLLGN